MDKELKMDNWIITMMLGGSLFLGGLALFAFMWAVNNGQFDDEEKFLNATKFDNEEDLNDAKVNEEKKRKSKRDYRPE
jgi:cbb3-type cytochrome oxidase maturation protein